MDLGVSGLASGFDWKTLVDQLAEVERQPQRRLLSDQNLLQQRNNAYSSIKTQLSILQNRVQAFTDGTLFSSRTATVSDEAAASVSVTSGTPLGSYSFNVTQLAASASQRGGSNVGAALSATDDVSGVILSEAGFGTSVTGGTFTVNGKQITIDAGDSLQSVFDEISAATGNTVIASYNATEDKITLTSAGEVVLGSATDTSNFLQAAKLQNNGSGTVTSSAALGAVRTGVIAANSNLTTALSDGGAGAGEFKINGVSIAFDTSEDSIQNILDRINESGAGVSATYDSVNDRFTLTNKTTGDVGIALEDVSGNFLAATGLSGGSLVRGKNLLYTINGGGQLSSQSNTITEATSGLTGLTVTALDEGATFDVVVSSDTGTIKQAIKDFISDYSKAQSVIDTQTASTTDSSGKVTAGVLANERDPFDIASGLRSRSYTQVSGLSGIFDSLADLGIVTNGNDNGLTLDDEAALDAALADNLTSVAELFTNSTNGLAVKLDAFLEDTIGDDGSLVEKQSNLSSQASAIDTDIESLERIVQQNRQRMIDSFVAMEAAQQRINQQLQYLQKQLGSASSSSK